MLHRLSRVAALIAVAIGAGACAARATAVPAPSAELSVPTVRPGDRIRLNIWNEPEMSDTFTVAESGMVILPKLGTVPVAGRRPESLQDSLRLAYGEFLRNPSVEVMVLRRVGVSGEVKQPGLYLVDLTTTLPDLITRAGGLTENGSPSRIVLIREAEEIPVGKQDPRHFKVAELRSGDRVVVGQRGFLARNPIVIVSTGVTVLTTLISVLIRQ